MDNPGIEVHFEARAACVAVLSEDHQLADRPIMTPQDLAGQRLIVAANPYRLRMQIDEALHRHEVAVSSIIDSNATYVSLALARRGVGVAIVESLTSLGLPLKGVKIIPLSFDISFKWSVITAIGRPIAPNIDAIIAGLAALGREDRMR